MDVILNCALNWLWGGPTLCAKSRRAAQRHAGEIKRSIREAPMLTVSRILAAALAFLIVIAFVSSPAAAQGAALSGQISSAGEGAMQGVVVSAKKQGSTITISVITNAEGRYSFPAGRLE